MWSTAQADHILSDRGLGPAYVVGVDLGQSQDYTAMVVVERRRQREVQTDGVVVTKIVDRCDWVIHGAERMGLGT
ncbi:MAG TPA: hypothetical protein DEH78_20325, partial [Solibacterales bacterium]|nr:hypothetical protein [Bryobacterales bacterium]